MTMSDAEVRHLIEEHWRNFLALARTGTHNAIGEATVSVVEFENRLDWLAADQGEVGARDFFGAVIDERRFLAFLAYDDPFEVQRHLGLEPLADPRVVKLLANLEFPTDLDPRPYIDEFWRVAIDLPANRRRRLGDIYTTFIHFLQGKLTDLPQEQEDAFFAQMLLYSTYYTQMYKIDPQAVRDAVSYMASPPGRETVLVRKAFETVLSKPGFSFFGLFKS